MSDKSKAEGFFNFDKQIKEAREIVARLESKLDDNMSKLDLVMDLLGEYNKKIDCINTSIKMLQDTGIQTELNTLEIGKKLIEIEKVLKSITLAVVPIRQHGKSKKILDK